MGTSLIWALGTLNVYQNLLKWALFFVKLHFLQKILTSSSVFASELTTFPVFTSFKCHFCTSAQHLGQLLHIFIHVYACMYICVVYPLSFLLYVCSHPYNPKWPTLSKMGTSLKWAFFLGPKGAHFIEVLLYKHSQHSNS